MINKEPLRSKDVRQRNEKLILKIIRQKGEISQSEVANITGLKPPTVFRIFSKLEEEGLISLTDKKFISDKKGRRPVFYRINNKACYAIGLDFWARNISIVLVDFAGTIILKKIENISEIHDADGILKKIIGLINDFLQEANLDISILLGIGIGAPGLVDIQKGEICHYTRIEGMIHFPLKAKLESCFETTVYVHNNAAVIAMHAYRYGKALHSQSTMTLILRSGVGGAFLQNGTVFVNNNKTSMEIGHMSMNIEGRICNCGARGCLETYLSEDAILNDLHEEITTPEDLDQRFEDADQQVLAVINDKIPYLAYGLRNLSQMFNPETFIIFARSVKLAEYLVVETKRYLQNNFTNEDDLDFDLIAELFDPIEAGLGASDLVFDNFFDFI